MIFLSNLVYQIPNQVSVATQKTASSFAEISFVHEPTNIMNGRIVASDIPIVGRWKATGRFQGHAWNVGSKARGKDQDLAFVDHDVDCSVENGIGLIFLCLIEKMIDALQFQWGLDMQDSVQELEYHGGKRERMA